MIAKLTIKRYFDNQLLLVEVLAPENAQPGDYNGKPMKDQEGTQIGEIIAAEIVKNG